MLGSKATRAASFMMCVVGLLVAVTPVLPASEKRADAPSMLEFLQTRDAPARSPVPRKVLAFYYTWYGTPEYHDRYIHWGDVDAAGHDISASTHYPALGAYDSHDPEVIDHHIELAKTHGVDAFICTWWGRNTYDDRALGKVLDRAREQDFAATVYWETAPGENQSQIDQAVKDLLYVLNRYGSHPAFLKVDGKPVIFVYGRVMNQVSKQQWPAIITEVERRYPGGFLLIADGYTAGNARLFDGIHVYNVCGWVQGNEGEELRELSRNKFTDAVELAKNAGKLSCLTIIPGYDDTPVRSPGLVAQRQKGQTYKTLWEEAIRADPDWVLITSWNEWHEGSEIEPSREHGSRYIELTGKYAGQFKKKRFSQVPVGSQDSGLPADQAKVLKRLFQNRPIAVLPGYENDVVFWLAEAGVALDELSWRDVTSPDRFNARKFPVVLYAGYEDYRRTHSDQGDVDQHVTRYLKEGGMLVAMPSGPFPFYYNQKGETVNSAARFGLPVMSGVGNPVNAPTGWETPPEGLDFTFHFQTEKLEGISATAPFPEEGDARWRPISDQSLKDEDVYIPLATLRDDTGRYWGDGIAYVEHRATAPPGGKGLYVWMRMPDVVDRHQLLFELFRFVAEKSRPIGRGQ
ncbi:MAG: endo-1,3-alpha-glucanase family glycosylhydrolase [Planctomycetota bacterium]